MTTTNYGKTALHLAAENGTIEDVRLLLQRDVGDINATDNVGYTPVMMACMTPDPCVDIVWLLLQAGANPALADADGMVPLHLVTYFGHIDLVDMLYFKAPATLNSCCSMGKTPLYVACDRGDKCMALKLLSLGPSHHQTTASPLAAAVVGGFVELVRVLITERRLSTFGGEDVIPNMLTYAVEKRQAMVAELLLTVGGRERRSQWANIKLNGTPILHYSTSYCYPAAVSVLLQAGADDAAVDPEGRTAGEVIGVGVRHMYGEDRCAIGRMLNRGPAYRARSWAWPLYILSDAGGNGEGTTDTTVTFDDNAAPAVVRSSPPTLNSTPILSGRIFRPKDKNGYNKFLVQLFHRYCAKPFNPTFCG